MSNQTSHYYNVLVQHFCQNPGIEKYAANLTRSFSDESNEVSMVAASVIMLLLVGVFFNLILFSRFSDVSAILDPKVRILISSALSLFLPVMSYLFSEAKNNVKKKSDDDLSLGAGVILVWMLLVELLRKKVDEIHMRGYSSTIQRAGRVIWLGSLVFFSFQSAGRKAVFGILWILCAAKVVQRIAFTEVGKRSYAHGKNARLITSYMSRRRARRRRRRQQEEQQEHVVVGVGDDVDVDVDVIGVGDDLLRASDFIVMGEQDLILEATADGYKLMDVAAAARAVTVGKIWRVLSSSGDIDPDQRLRRLCLSFALFKLLRRRFDHLPVTEEETQDCRDLIFNGVYNGKEENVDAVFQVVTTEVNFLSEYYHSVIPVVFASPFFFLANYLLLPVVVLGLCLMTVVLCGNGSARYAFRSIGQDNFAISAGLLSTTACLLLKSSTSPDAFFTTIDFFVTFLLFIIFLYEEIWEFVVFLLSNWFMVSLLCSYYVGRPQWVSSPTFGGIVRRILWVRSKMSQPDLSFKQFSALNTRWPLAVGMPSILSNLLRTAPVPNKAKHSIMECLVKHSRGLGVGGARPPPPLSNGQAVLVEQQERRPRLLAELRRACDSDSVAEVILTWHIATSLLEDKEAGKDDDGRVVATRLSRYCAYLVAFHQELLPDNPDKTEKVFEGMKAELKAKLNCGAYYLSRWRARLQVIAGGTAGSMASAQWKDKQVVHNGAKLAHLLREYCDDSHPERTCWKLLADFWTELIVYIAPSNDVERVMGHEKVLVDPGEFITALWTLTTHTGITRPSTASSI